MSKEPEEKAVCPIRSGHADRIASFQGSGGAQDNAFSSPEEKLAFCNQQMPIWLSYSIKADAAGSGLAQKESGTAFCAVEGATAQSASVPPAAPGGTPVPRLPDAFGDAPAGRIPCFTDIAQFLQYFLALSARGEGE